MWWLVGRVVFCVRVLFVVWSQLLLMVVRLCCRFVDPYRCFSTVHDGVHVVFACVVEFASCLVEVCCYCCRR
jgi:hypothetical protein